MSALLLRHYAAAPVSVVTSRQQIDRPNMKPRGFWLSVDSCEQNWPHWCEGERFGLDRLAVAHDVSLRPTARVLTLRSDVDLWCFTRDYRKEAYPNLRDYFGIQWDKVAERWQGIIITPYLWSMRLDQRTSWYYGWDCASGCIWDADAIESIAPIQSERQAA